MRSFLLALALAVSCGTLAQAQDLDTVKTGADTIRGSISAMSPTEVTVTLKDETTKPIPVNQIEYVQFGSEPRDLRLARISIVRGGYDEAADALEKVTDEEAAEISRDEVKADLAYYKALVASKHALAGKGELLDAAKLMIAYLNANKESFHYFEGAEVTGDIATAIAASSASSADAADRKKATAYYASAQKYYSELAKAPWPEFKMRAAMGLGKSLQAQGKDAEALKQYDAALALSKSAAEGAQSTIMLARLGKASALAATGGAKEAIKLVEQVIDKADPEAQEVYARAYNTLGTCYRKLGQDEDAVLAFLHVHVLFSSQGEAHAEALWNLVGLWEKIKRGERAQEARNLLEENYSGSRWARMKAG